MKTFAWGGLPKPRLVGALRNWPVPVATTPLENPFHFVSVALKVKCLHDYHLRILHAIVPVPSGLDGATILKWFSQTLLSKSIEWDVSLPRDHMKRSWYPSLLSAVLRDVKVKESPLEMVRSVDEDSRRMALYPHLDYRGLYSELTHIIDIVPLIQYGLHGKSAGS